MKTYRGKKHTNDKSFLTSLMRTSKMNIRSALTVKEEYMYIYIYLKKKINRDCYDV